MKKILTIVFALCSLATFAQQLKFKIGTDAATGKVIKYTHIETRFQNGSPIELIGKISFHEVANENNDALPVNATALAKKAVESFTENYSCVGRYIDTTTKLYLNAEDVGAVLLTDYLRDKAVNSYPSTAGADPLSKLVEGICKEVINIRKANGEFTN